MRDIVVIPCYERPEFTRICLKHLAQARGIQDKEVWLCQDRHLSDKDPDAMVWAMESNVLFGHDHFPGRFSYNILEPHATYGNSRNLVEALSTAVDAGPERIFLVEDDIAVSPDFFSWHEAVLDQPGVFVSCATSLNKSAHFQTNGPEAMDESLQDPAAYYLSQGAYSSHATAFKTDNLKSILGYLFGCTNWASGWEQDLLTQRFLKAIQRRSAWPYVPRAFNIGWYSYHITGSQFTGTLEEKVRAIESAIKDPAKLKNISTNNNAVTALPEKWPPYVQSVHNIQRTQ